MSKSSRLWTITAVVALALGAATTATLAGAKKKKLYQVKSHALGTVKNGASASVRFDIVPGKGAKVHPKAPFKCRVSGSTTAVAPLKAKLGKKDLTWGKKRVVTVTAPFKAQQAGTHQLKANCDFFICTKSICARRTEKVQFEVKVKGK